MQKQTRQETKTVSKTKTLITVFLASSAMAAGFGFLAYDNYTKNGNKFWPKQEQIIEPEIVKPGVATIQTKKTGYRFQCSRLGTQNIIPSQVVKTQKKWSLQGPQNAVSLNAVALGDMDGNGKIETASNFTNLDITNSASQADELYLLNDNGIVINQSWPMKFPFGEETIISDINDDGKNEIIFGGKDNFNSSYNGLQVLDQNGSKLPGFPYQANVHDSWPNDINNLFIGNLSGDKKEKEIAFWETNAGLTVVDSQGNKLNKKSLPNSIPISLINVTGGEKEQVLVMETTDFEQEFTFKAINADSSEVSGFSPRFNKFMGSGSKAFLLENTGHAIFDFNNDGKDDVFLSMAGSYNFPAQPFGIVLGFHHDGSGIPNFPLNFNSPANLKAAVDFEGDGMRELVIATDNGLEIFSELGKSYASLPKIDKTCANFKMDFTFVYFADIDGDNDLEIITPAQFDLGYINTPKESLIVAYHHDGTMVNSFPMLVESNQTSQDYTGASTNPKIMNMTIGDLDKNGKLDIVGSIHSDEAPAYSWGEMFVVEIKDKYVGNELKVKRARGYNEGAKRYIGK